MFQTILGRIGPRQEKKFIRDVDAAMSSPHSASQRVQCECADQNGTHVLPNIGEKGECETLN